MVWTAGWSGTRVINSSSQLYVAIHGAKSSSQRAKRAAGRANPGVRECDARGECVLCAWIRREKRR